MSNNVKVLESSSLVPRLRGLKEIFILALAEVETLGGLEDPRGLEELLIGFILLVE